MNVRRRAVLLSMVISAFLTYAAATGVRASDDTEKNVSPKDASVKVVMPVKQENEKDEEAIKHSSDLSYGMQIIKRAKKLKKTSLRASIGFESSDFAEFTDSGRVVTLTIRSLPSESEGVLKLGALDVFAGQNIAEALINKLKFIPSHAGAEAVFTFSVNGGEDIRECVLCSLKKENYAPQAQPLSVYTKQNVAAYAGINASDPDGDEISCTVISQPSHGLLKINGDGEFSYSPDKNYTGTDSFVCCFEDKYGNKSEPVTVKLRTERNTSGIVYSDMSGNKAEYGAYLLAEKGILTGQIIGDTAFFEPEKTVTRADFIVMAMKAAGYSPNVYSSLRQGFTDADQLTQQQRGYVVTAMSAKVIEAEENDGSLSIRPADNITKKEANAIISSLCDKTVPVASVKDDNKPLTRAEAAVMLAAVIDGRR
ncbi:MAG: cadherin-like domain-containing protein [Clostridia bacterium]|nr:cadherin-like domain-containing protein [Clostridia bacterium]